MGTVDTLTLRIEVQDDGTAVLKDVRGTVRDLSTDVEQSSRKSQSAFSRLNTGIKDVGSTANRVGGEILGGVLVGGIAAMAGGVAMGVRSLAAFDDQMVGVRKTTGMSVEEIDGLGNSLREMASAGGSLAGTTAMELGTIAEVAGQLGIQGKDAILTFSETIAEMTIATGMSAEEAASGMAAIGNIFRDSLTASGETVAAQMDNIGSGFDALEDSTNASASSILDMVGRMGGAATQLGLSVAETAGIAATLADRGVDIEVAGTAMSKFFLDLLTNSNSWASAMKLDADAFSTALKTEPMHAIQMVVEGMASMKDTQGPDALAATLDDLGVKDTRLIDAMLKLGDAHADLEKNVNTVNEATKEGVRLHESASIAAESSVKQYGLMKERLTEVGRGVGEVFEPMTTAALNFANTGLNAAIEGLGEIKTNGEEVGNFFGDAFGIEGVGTAFKHTFDAITGTFEELSTNAGAFGTELKSVFLDNVKSVGTSIVTAASELASGVTSELVDPTLASLAAIPGKVSETVVDLAASVSAPFVSGWKTVTGLTDATFDGIVTQFGLEGAQTTFQTGLGTVTEAWNTWQTDSQGVTTAFFDGLVADFAIEDAYTSFQSGIGKVQTLWTTFTASDWSAWTTAPKQAFADILTSGQDAWTDLKAAPKDVVDEIASVFGTLDDKVMTAFGDLKGSIADTLSGLLDGIPGPVKKLLGLEGAPEPVEFDVDATAAMQALHELKSANQDLLISNTDLRAEYQAIRNELTAAIEAGIAPSDELIGRMDTLRESVHELGVEAYGRSTFPDMTAAMLESREASSQLTAEIQSSTVTVAELGAAYEQAQAKVEAKEAAIRTISQQIRQYTHQAETAWGLERDRLEEAAKALANKKQLLHDDLALLRDHASTSKRAYSDAAQTLKEQERAHQSVDNALQKSTAEAQTWANAYAKHALTVSYASENHRKQVEKDLEKMGKEGQKWAMAYAQHAMTVSYANEETEASFTDMAQTALDAFDSIAGGLGGLSSNVGNLGDLLGIEELGGVGDFLGDLQQYAEIPAMFGEIGGSISGIVEGLGSLGGLGDMLGGLTGGLGGLGSSISGLFGNLGGLFGGGGLSGIFSGLSGTIGGLGSALTGLLPALGPLGIAGGAIALAWDPLKDIFSGLFDTQSEGTKAANAFQEFVSANISGGQEMSAALQQSFHDMSAAGFDYATFLQQTGTTMDQTFGGISQNWEQGSTAMDLFVQSVGQATGNMEKAPQVALQMMASFQDMGLSAQEAGQKMLEIAQASGMSSQQVEALRVALGGLGAEAEATGQKERSLNESTTSLGESMAGLDASLQEAGARAQHSSHGLETMAVAEEQAAQSAGHLSGAFANMSVGVGDIEGSMIRSDQALAQFGANADVLGLIGTQIFGESLPASMLESEQGMKQAEEGANAVEDAIRAIPKRHVVNVIIRKEKQGDIPGMAQGGWISDWHDGLVIYNELGPEIAKYPGGTMALLTTPGPALGAFPVGTEIIPHTRVSDILRRYPAVPQMARGGRVAAIPDSLFGGETLIVEKIEVLITNNTFQQEMDVRQVVQSAMLDAAGKLQQTRRKRR